MSIFSRSFLSSTGIFSAVFRGGTSGANGAGIPMQALAHDPDTPVDADHPLAVAMGTIDSTGTTFNPADLPQTLTYNSDGTVATIAATNGVNTWTQSLTYAAGRLTGISKWVKS